MSLKRNMRFSAWPVVRKLHLPEKPVRRKIKAAEGSRSFVASIISHSSLHTIIALYLIALLFALNVILRFPDLGGIIAQYNQF